MPEASHSTNTTLYAVTFIHLALQSLMFNTNKWQKLSIALQERPFVNST